MVTPVPKCSIRTRDTHSELQLLDKFNRCRFEIKQKVLKWIDVKLFVKSQRLHLERNREKTKYMLNVLKILHNMNTTVLSPSYFDKIKMINYQQNGGNFIYLSKIFFMYILYIFL